MQGLADSSAKMIRDYFLGKYQAEWCMEHGIEVMSFRQLKDLLYEETPEEAHTVAARILGGVRRQAREDEDSRCRYKEEAEAAFNISPLRVLDPGLPQTSASFLGFNITNRNNSVKEAYEATRFWLTKFSPPILLLAGPPGTGKTHLSLACGRILRRGHRPFIYRDEARLLGELRRRLETKTMDEALEELCTVPWLFIDDLGAAALTDWGRAVMDQIINARWQNAAWARTMIGTNLFSDELPPRLASRLGDVAVSRVVAVSDKDYRLMVRR